MCCICSFRACKEKTVITVPPIIVPKKPPTPVNSPRAPNIARDKPIMQEANEQELWCALCGKYHADMKHVTMSNLKDYDFQGLEEIRRRNIINRCECPNMSGYEASGNQSKKVTFGADIGVHGGHQGHTRYATDQKSTSYSGHYDNAHKGHSNAIAPMRGNTTETSWALHTKSGNTRILDTHKLVDDRTDINAMSAHSHTSIHSSFKKSRQ